MDATDRSNQEKMQNLLNMYPAPAAALLEVDAFNHRACNKIQATVLCSEQRSQNVYEKIGALTDPDLDCIGSMCRKEGSAHQCCGVLRALSEAPIITEVQTEQKNKDGKDKMQKFLNKFRDALIGDASDDSQPETADEPEPASKPVAPASPEKESAPVPAAVVLPASRPTGLSPGCKPLAARHLCQEQRASQVFEAIGSMGLGDLDCIGSLCLTKGSDHACCGVLRALAASPIVTEKPMDATDRANQEKMQNLLIRYPAPAASLLEVQATDNRSYP